MPHGRAGTRAMAAAVHTSLYGVAMCVYGAIGAFGASIFGPETAGNIMLNTIIEVGCLGCWLAGWRLAGWLAGRLAACWLPGWQLVGQPLAARWAAWPAACGCAACADRPGAPRAAPARQQPTRPRPACPPAPCRRAAPPGWRST